MNHLLSYDNIPLNTHSLVIDLRFVLKENNKEAFEKALNNIEMNSVSPKLQTSIKPFRKHHEMIRNTFDFNNLTNGLIEGINNKIKLIQRVLYGYRNFNNLCSRIIL